MIPVAGEGIARLPVLGVAVAQVQETRAGLHEREVVGGVRVLDDFATGRRENLAHLTGAIEWCEGSILEPETLRRAVAGVEIVFHQAAIPSVPRSVRNRRTVAPKISASTFPFFRRDTLAS